MVFRLKIGLFSGLFVFFSFTIFLLVRNHTFIQNSPLASFSHLAYLAAWLCSLAPAGNPIYCPIGHQIWAPLGNQDLCPNFVLTAAKFVFSNSGNFGAKANPLKPRSCPKRPFGQ